MYKQVILTIQIVSYDERDKTWLIIGCYAILQAAARVILGVVLSSIGPCPNVWGPGALWHAVCCKIIFIVTFDF